MKKAELRQIIKEEYKKILNEGFEFKIKNSMGDIKVVVGDASNDSTIRISQQGKAIYFSPKDFRTFLKETEDLRGLR